jgi:putative intracellular protease/amidase
MIKLRIFALFLAQLFLAVSLSPAFSEDSNSVLMIVSSYGKDGGKTQPGYEFDEFARAYLVFRAHGFDVDIASPAGGAVEADEYDADKPYNQNVLADAAIINKLAHTLPTAAVNPDDYRAVFVVGGKGAMFDLPGDADLQKIIATLYEDGRVVAAVCHGPAALVDVRLSNGEYLLSGKRVNGFTNVEEQLFGKRWMSEYPFMLEDKLVERGGKYESSAFMLSHVAQDGKLITGQNPVSTTDVATAVVRALGAKPRPQQRFTEDVTMALIAELLASLKAS